MKEVEEKDNDISDKIKIFSSDDEKLKILGELLSNKSSRDMIKLLTYNEYYTNEIADRLNLRANLVIHHLKKLENLGLLEVRNKKIIKKGNEHRYFRMIPNLFIIPNHTKEEIEEKGILKKIFKNTIRYVIIGIVAFGTWVFTQQPKISIDPKMRNPETLIENSSNFDTLIIPLLIVISGLVFEIILMKKKN